MLKTSSVSGEGGEATVSLASTAKSCFDQGNFTTREKDNESDNDLTQVLWFFFFFFYGKSIIPGSFCPFGLSVDTDCDNESWRLG